MIDDDISNEIIDEFTVKVNTLSGCSNLKEQDVNCTARLFLRARKLDVDRAVELYKANKRMRYSENVISIDPLEEGVRRELLSGKFTILLNEGEDESVGTVAIFTANQHWPPLTTHRDVLKGVLYQLDFAMMHERSQRHGLIVVYDMRDTKYTNFDYHLCIKLLNLFTDIYPARLRKLIIVDAPFWFRAPVGVLRYFVKEKIRDRVFTVDFANLHEHLPPRLVTTWFDRQQHFDWLRRCLQQTGHADKDRLPADYFTAIRPPMYRSLSQPAASSSPSSSCSSTISSSTIKSKTRPMSSTSTSPAASEMGRYQRFTSRKSTPRFQVYAQQRQRSVDRTDSVIRIDDLDSSPLLSRNIPTPNKSASPGQQRQHHVKRILISGVEICRDDSGGNSNNIVRVIDVTRPNVPTAVASSPSNARRPLDRLNATDPSSPTRVSVDEFIDRVRRTDKFVFIAEFNTMFNNQNSQKEMRLQESCSRFQQPENRRRNRYIDVPCLDSTAVELSDNTYLHASWVSGYKQANAYILAQGPLENTRRDFWMAVWEQRVPVIAMLTRVVESQRVKCATYWPTACPLSMDSPVTERSSSSLGDNLSNNNIVYTTNTTTNSSTTTGTTGTTSSTRSCPTTTGTIGSLSAQYGEFVVTNLGESLEAGGLYRHTRLSVSRVMAGGGQPSASCSSSSSMTTTSPTMVSRWTSLSRSPRVFRGKKVGRLAENFLVEPQSNRLEVDHFLYLGWPDFDVPSDTEGFLTFLAAVKQRVQQSHGRSRQQLQQALDGSSLRIIRELPAETATTTAAASDLEPNGTKTIEVVSHRQTPSERCSPSVGPLLIHCSAGIGRTGTFVTVDICLEQAVAEGFIDLPDVVTCLRQQRSGAVQVGKQYAFAHQVIARQLERLKSPGRSICDAPPSTTAITNTVRPI